MVENSGFKKRVRAGFTTNAKGKAQMDITVEILDPETQKEVTELLDGAVKSVKEVLNAEGFVLAE